MDMNEATSLKLDGEWEFYWERFVQPEEFNAAKPPEPTLYAPVPSYWKEYKHAYLDFTGTGYASYRMILLLPETRPDKLALDIPVFDVSSALYLNGKPVHEQGKVGRTKEESVPGYNPGLFILSTESDTLSIVVHVSNFYHRRGGFWKSMQLGHVSRLVQADRKYKLVSFFSLGVLAAFSVFFLFFFILYREDFLLLSFSMIVAGIFLRMICTGLYPIQLVSDIPWEWLIKIEYFGTFLAFGFSAWYFFNLYPSEFRKRITWINGGIVLIAGFIILLLKARYFAYTMLYFQPAILLLMAYYLVICIRRVIGGSRNDILFLIALVIFVGGLVNDILVANSRTAISKDYSIHFAVQLFVLIQSIMIIRTWILAYKERGLLMAEIEDININLEKRVEDRTTELNSRNIAIEASNKELKNALDFKNRVFSIIAHDLKSPIATLVQNSALLDFKLTGEEQEKLVKSFREQSRSSLNLIDNLLYWGRSQGSKLQLSPDMYEMQDIVKEVLDSFLETVAHKSIRIREEFTGATMAFVDREVIEIVIRNLISNAIKFTNRYGSIQIKASVEPEDKLAVQVIDNGVGMNQEQINSIYGEKEIISTAGTDNERGTGLGLRLCSDLLNEMGGEMKVSSKKGQGTEVTLVLPAHPNAVLRSH
jgi:signal transduction histidine kinase